MATISKTNQSLTQALKEASAVKNEWHTIALNIIQGGASTISAPPPPQPRLFPDYNEVTNMQFKASYLPSGNIRPHISAELVNDNGLLVAQTFVPGGIVKDSTVNTIDMKLNPMKTVAPSGNNLYILRIRVDGSNTPDDYYYEDSVTVKVG